ncbi:MAG: hypothetical protein LH624_07160 [Cryobacterium sp.]|nr:hypothetical protein [Cryobacterium sp.]
MIKAAVIVGALLCLISGALVLGLAPQTNLAQQNETTASQSIVIRDSNGAALTTLPLNGTSFALRYRNSIYHTMAEERFEVLPDGSFRLVQIAADQLAVIEEYYVVSEPAVIAESTDRRRWVVPSDPDRQSEFAHLSVSGTDLGERTVLIPGSEPVALWKLTQNDHPFLDLSITPAPSTTPDTIRHQTQETP